MSINDAEIKICVCRICLDSKCSDLVVLDELNGWFIMFEYCFSIALTVQDKPRVICKSCADNVKSYAKFKDQCQKSDSLWKSMNADAKCYIPKFTHNFEENVLNSTQQNLELSKNESFNTCDSVSSILHSSIDIPFTENAVETDNDVQTNDQETTHEENIGNVCVNNSFVQLNHLEGTTKEVNIENVSEKVTAEIQEEDLNLKYSEDIKNLPSNRSIKTVAKKFYNCKNCKKKYSKKKWYLIHTQVCKSRKYAKNKGTHSTSHQTGRLIDSRNNAIDNNGVATANNEFQSDKCIQENFNIIGKQDKQLFCGICEYNCANIDNLCKHLDEHWSNNDLACRLCEFIGDDLADIITHRFSHFPVKWKPRFVCHICKQVKFSKMSLHFHYRFEHLKKSGGFCLRCNKEFKRLRTWKLHERSHNSPGYICDICGKNFTYKYLIKEHLMNHTNIARNICDVCGKAFKQSTYLRLHVAAVHVTTEPIKCTHCNKMFKSQHTLRMHQKKLAGKNVYKCEVCGKGYHAPTYLRAHMVMHSDERPYCCDFCGCRYKAKSALKIHIRKHTGYMPFKCPACPKEFASPSQLKVHSSVHTGVRRVSCMHCTRTFHCRKRLLNHCVRHHKNEMVKNSE